MLCGPQPPQGKVPLRTDSQYTAGAECRGRLQWQSLHRIWKEGVGLQLARAARLAGGTEGQLGRQGAELWYKQ